MLEKNKVYLGNCLELLPNIEDHTVDMILADLPYGITSAKFDIIIPFEPMWKEFKRILKLEGVIVLTSSQPFSSMLVMSNLEMYKHEWIWQKNRGSNFANQSREPFKEHDHILVFANKKWTYNKQMQERAESGKSRVKYDFNTVTDSENYRKFEYAAQSKGKELRVPSSIQKFNVEVGKHPQQKPVLLGEYLIKTYTNEEDLILDPTMGSGSFLVAAKNLKRNYIGIEKEERFYNITKERLL